MIWLCRLFFCIFANISFKKLSKVSLILSIGLLILTIYTIPYVGFFGSRLEYWLLSKDLHLKRRELKLTEIESRHHEPHGYLSRPGPDSMRRISTRRLFNLWRGTLLILVRCYCYLRTNDTSKIVILYLDK
jgi:hypothetical protein